MLCLNTSTPSTSATSSSVSCDKTQNPQCLQSLNIPPRNLLSLRIWGREIVSWGAAEALDVNAASSMRTQVLVEVCVATVQREHDRGRVRNRGTV